MLRRLAKRRLARIETDIRLLEKRLTETIAAEADLARRKMITTLNAMLRDGASWQPQAA